MNHTIEILRISKQKIILLSCIILLIISMIIYHQWNKLSGVWTSDKTYAEITIKHNNIVVTGEEKQFSHNYKGEPIVGKVNKFNQTVILYDTKHYLSKNDRYTIKYKLVGNKLILVSNKLDESYEK